MTHDSKDLEKVYNDVFGDAVKYMDDYEVQAVAATYMAIAIRLYKTSLSNDGFHDMLQTVLDSEGDIKSYADDKNTLH